LTNNADLLEVPVGKRMSWTSSRRTSRVEDLAYCLLGIFDLNMPLIYGEGEKAFIRLQEEISKQTNDLSLFAWTSQDSTSQRFRGIMAKSPSEFAQCGALVSYKNYMAPQKEFAMTNNGVRMSATLRFTTTFEYVWIWSAAMRCRHDWGYFFEKLSLVS
jgi:hypothetical protein